MVGYGQPAPPSAPQTTVRRLFAADAEDYRTIRLAALATSPEAFGSVHAAQAARPLADHAERLASSLVFGAYDGAAIVGMIGMQPEDGPKDAHKGFVWGFFVAPDYRRQGVGAGLVAALIDASCGVVEQLKLAVVRDNAGAIALYEKSGFVIYGVEPRALKDGGLYQDEVLMFRRL